MAPSAVAGGTEGTSPVEAAVAWLSRFQPAELAAVAARWRLPAPDPYGERLEVLESALRAGRVPARHPHELEAMRRFVDLNLDEQREFLKRCGLPVGDTQINVLRRIEDNLGPQGVPVETAFDYLDERFECGGQHVFLFQLDSDAASRLRDRDTLWSRIRELRPALPATAPGDRELVRDRLYLPQPRAALLFETEVEAAAPVLVAAYWRQTPGRELILKWVETRAWQRVVQATENPLRLNLSERAVSFFRLDTHSWEAELRIQRLRPNPLRSLREEFELLRGQLLHLLEAEALQPRPIEPAIRRLLTSEGAQVVHWEVSWPDSGRLKGGIDPGMVQGLFRRFRDYAAVSLVAEWPLEDAGARAVQVKLDALTNEVHVPRRCTSADMQLVLADIRRGAAARLRGPGLERMARARNDWRPVLQQIERTTRGIKEAKEIDLRRLSRDSWLDEAGVLEVADRLQASSPATFELHLTARCSDTGHPAVDAEGRPVSFSSLDDLPQAFRCRHDQPLRWEEHPTTGNIAAVLVAKPEPARGALLDRIEPRVERWLGMRAARGYVNMLALLLFTVLYCTVVLGTAAAFLKLNEAFGGGVDTALMLAVPFGVMMLLEVGIVVKLLGGPVTRTAVSVLESLTALFAPRRGRRPAGEPPPAVQAGDGEEPDGDEGGGATGADDDR